MQAVVQQQFISVCMFTQTDLLQQMRTRSKGSVLLQHCINDGDRYCFMGCKCGAGQGLFRVAFVETFNTQSKSLLQLSLNNPLSNCDVEKILHRYEIKE